MNKCIAAQKERLGNGIYKMTFYTDNCGFTRPAQYAVIYYSNRRESWQVCDYDSRRFTVVFRNSDSFHSVLSDLEFGAEIKAETGRGNGFDVDSVPNGAYLVADSMGISEMLELARCMLTRGKSFKVVLGYASKSEIFMVDSFRNICNEIEVLTLDGSNGREGMPSDVVRNADYVCASGSIPMLKALAPKCREGQFSLSSKLLFVSDESGECMVDTTEGIKNCIKDGPVFDKNKVNWETL